MRVKLADFGLSRQIFKGSEGEVSLFQARWTAPEIWDYMDDSEDEYYDGDYYIKDNNNDNDNNNNDYDDLIILIILLIMIMIY